MTNEHTNDNAVMLERPGFPPVAVPPLDGELVVAPAARAAAADDFGHLVRRMPLAVLRPGSVQDIAAMIRWSSENGWQIAARGLGHSVFGRSQVAGGIVVDMSTLDGIRHVERDQVVVDAGATWRAILARTLPERRTPPVLTNYLDLSVGGTLSVGGIGGTSHRYGLQTDNVLELEVVTPGTVRSHRRSITGADRRCVLPRIRGILRPLYRRRNAVPGKRPFPLRRRVGGPLRPDVAEGSASEGTVRSDELPDPWLPVVRHQCTG
jgi:FAD/FMN-containing dehydrogenase